MRGEGVWVLDEGYNCIWQQLLEILEIGNSVLLYLVFQKIVKNKEKSSVLVLFKVQSSVLVHIRTKMQKRETNVSSGPFVIEKFSSGP